MKELSQIFIIIIEGSDWNKLVGIFLFLYTVRYGYYERERERRFIKLPVHFGMVKRKLTLYKYKSIICMTQDAFVFFLLSLPLNLGLLL